MNLVVIFIGGGLGSLLRFGVSKLVLTSSSTVFPYATLLANVLSCVIMGAFMALAINKFDSHWVKYFVLVGLCGGFSTFSTFSLETLELIKNGHMMIAILNIIISVLMCISVIYVTSTFLKA